MIMSMWGMSTQLEITNWGLHERRQVQIKKIPFQVFLIQPFSLNRNFTLHTIIYTAKLHYK